MERVPILPGGSTPRPNQAFCIRLCIPAEFQQDLRICSARHLSTLFTNLQITSGSRPIPLPAVLLTSVKCRRSDFGHFGHFIRSFVRSLTSTSTSSSLRITDRSFRYASPCLWNQLPNSLRQPYSSPSVSDFPVDAPATSSYSLNLPLSPSITPSLFHSRLKTYLFHKSFPP